MLRKYMFIWKKSRHQFRTPFFSKSGRNFRGRLCVFHQGGLDKHNLITVDRFRFINAFGFVLRIIDDFFRTSFLGMVLYENGLLNFILLCEGVLKNGLVFSGALQFLKCPVGSTQRLGNIVLFEAISSIEKFPRSGAVLARSAGSFAKIVSRDTFKALLKLNSGWQIQMSTSCLAALGVSSNISFIFQNVRKAGINRSRGVRPRVRGVVKNPCDHPHGGGEGKGSPPVAQVSPWGWLCKGTPSKNKKKDRLMRRLFKRF